MLCPICNGPVVAKAATRVVDAHFRCTKCGGWFATGAPRAPAGYVGVYGDSSFRGTVSYGEPVAARPTLHQLDAWSR